MPFDHQLAKKLLSPWKLRLWMVSKLPMGLLSGMVIEALDEKGCRVMLKDRRWIRNPFGSVFWAVMGMAAELSTGALMYTFASGTGMKFILVGIEAKFFKKARGKSFYFCDAGPEVYQAFNESKEKFSQRLHFSGNSGNQLINVPFITSPIIRWGQTYFLLRVLKIVLFILNVLS
jgi:YHS domain-containing protein